jgi:stage V sporulation protein SpoVS
MKIKKSVGPVRVSAKTAPVACDIAGQYAALLAQFNAVEVQRAALWQQVVALEIKRAAVKALLDVAGTMIAVSRGVV